MVSQEFERVRDLLVDETGVRSSKVTEQARLVEDLGIYGDDLAEFMDRFFADLAVDPAAFDSSSYIPDEGLSLFRRARQTRRLTVAMLTEALRLGRWPDDG